MALRPIYDKAVPTPASYIRYKGVWDMQDLYESMVGWFRERKYKFHEKIYKHKHPSPFGVERQYMWFAERKEGDYEQVQYNIYMHTYDAHDIGVVMPDGSKKEYTKGRLWIELKVSFHFDWEKRWDSTSFYRTLKDFYNRYIIRKKYMEGYGPKFRDEFHQLQALVRNRLKMESDQFEYANMAGVHARKV